MNKVNYLQKITAGSRLSYENRDIFYALILALSPDETVNFFDLSFEQHYQVRQWITKKICLDMKAKIIPAQFELIDLLNDMVNVKGFTKRASCAYALTTLINKTTSTQQISVIQNLLCSIYLVVREKAYKRLRYHWDYNFKPQLLLNWETFKDKKCLNIILTQFSNDDLLENFDLFKPYLSPFQLTGLLIRFPEFSKFGLEYLREIDQISYVYFLTKQGKKIPEKEASEIMEMNFLNKRVGLLLWCFGKMGLFKILVDFKEIYMNKIMTERLSEYGKTVLLEGNF